MDFEVFALAGCPTEDIWVVVGPREQAVSHGAGAQQVRFLSTYLWWREWSERGQQATVCPNVPAVSRSVGKPAAETAGMPPGPTCSAEPVEPGVWSGSGHRLVDTNSGLQPPWPRVEVGGAGQ